ncbi:MAG: methyltransferase domain-containing protein [Thermoleophilia bacterium]|nr:methyltransferase domain-containing protein [Thermoleophilia bacterium]
MKCPDEGPRADRGDHGQVIYQHPLAYLLGLEGIALLRAFAGEHDRDFVLARLDEIGRLLDSEELQQGIHATPLSIQEGYAQWAPRYDEPGNELLELEQPVVWEILDGLPVGAALDAACGTGRHAARLAALGHRVIGVDATPEMLEIARRKAPGGEFHEGDLHELPLADDSVDLVVCGIAVSHVPDLVPVFAEVVRVLRPGGHFVLSDSRGRFADIGLPLVRERPDGTYGYMRAWSRLASEYLGAALPLGLQVRRCEELRLRHAVVGADGTDLYDGSPSPEYVPGGVPNIWALHPLAVEATNAALAGKPVAIVWHFQLEAGRR